MAITSVTNERIRLLSVALLFFANVVVETSNEVVATSGFISHLGAAQILWLKAIDAVIIVLAAGVYSLIVDRANRRKLAIVLFAGFGLCYAAIYLMFLFNAPQGLTYTALKLITGQQDNLLQLVLGALAADIFSVAESKRLFGLLGAASIAGELAGDGFAVAAAHFLKGDNTSLLLTNVMWLFAGAAVLAFVVGRVAPPTRQVSEEEGLVDVLRGGVNFVREVKLFRYLTIIVLWSGVGWSVVEYQFLFKLSEAFPDTEDLQFSYGIFQFGIPILLLLVQTVGLRWMLRLGGYKASFLMMPGALFLGLSLMLVWPGLISVVIGAYLAKVTAQGIQEPSEQSFLGLVPDELRGRMGAFLHGLLYPFGELLGYVFVGVVILLVSTPQRSWWIYGGVAWVCLAISFGTAIRLMVTYDKEMLNWRWQRRRRQGVSELGL